MQDFTNIKIDLGLLKKDNEITNKVVEKIAESIEKMQEINLNLSKVIAMHEEKHDYHEKTEDELKTDIKELHLRIDEVEKNIAGKIESLRTDLLNNKSTFYDSIKNIEKYKWMILGGATILGWVIGHINLNALNTILK